MVSKYELKMRGRFKNEREVSKLGREVSKYTGVLTTLKEGFKTGWEYSKYGREVSKYTAVFRSFENRFENTNLSSRYLRPHMVTPAPSKFGPGPLKNRSVPAGGGRGPGCI